MSLSKLFLRLEIEVRIDLVDHEDAELHYTQGSELAVAGFDDGSGEPVPDYGVVELW